MRFKPEDHTHLVGRKYKDDDGNVWMLTGIMLCPEDYYWYMVKQGAGSNNVRNHKMLSCVGDPENHGYELISKSYMETEAQDMAEEGV